MTEIKIAITDLQNRRHKWEINTLRVLCSPTNTTKKITQYNIRYMISQQKSKRKINKYCVLIIKGNKEADKAAKQAIDMPEMTTTRHSYTDNYLTIRRARNFKWQRVRKQY